jgi:hypothetical protein
MPSTLEEVAYDLARAALDEQREFVTNLRGSAAPLLAVSGALTALLAKPATASGVSFSRGPLHGTLLAAGIAGGVVALLGALLVLAKRSFSFAVDSTRLYTVAYADRESPEIYLRRIAEAHLLRRDENRRGVLWMQRCLAAGLLGVVLELLGFGLALAVH